MKLLFFILRIIIIANMFLFAIDEKFCFVVNNFE